MSSKIISMTIEELGLSIRSFSCLKRAGIDTVEDLISRTEDDMVKVRNLGRKSLEEVILKLNALGLTLKQKDKDEMQELVNARLLSNGYGNYSYVRFNEVSKEISIKCDKCGTVIITTMVEIEDGTLPTECVFCKKVELDKQLGHQREIAEIIADFDLELIRIEESDYTKENYKIRCKHCGKEYYLDDDFDLDSDPLEMCCKNWDCMISLLSKKGHWFAEGLKTGDVEILELDYSPHYSPMQFIMDYEDWFDSLEEHNGTCDIKCSKCGTHRIIPFGKWYEDDCDACCYVKQNDFEITKWDKIDEKVYIHCLHCDSRYVITEEQAFDEVFDCFKCFEQKNKEKITCPVCHTELSKGIRFCDTCGFCLDVLNSNKIQGQEQYTQWLADTILYCGSVWYSSKKEIEKLKSELVILQKTLKQSEDSVRALSQTNLDLIDVVDALSFSNADRCEINRSARKKIAEANGVVYLSSECTAPSMCTGVCDKCNAEIRYFNSEIKRLESEGHKIIIPEEILSCYVPDISSVAKKIKLRDLGLSPVALNPLGRYGIKTLGQLSEMNSAELIKVRSLGRRGYEEIIKVLSKFGLSLKEN